MTVPSRAIAVTVGTASLSCLIAAWWRGRGHTWRAGSCCADVWAAGGVGIRTNAAGHNAVLKIRMRASPRRA